MANLIGLVGPSGTGKSTSLGHVPELNIEGLNPKETIIISIAGKPLPFRGWKKQYPLGEKFFVTDDATTIATTIQSINDNRPEVKNIVIDDAGYIMSFVFMDKAREKGYDKFSLIAEAGYKPIRAAENAKRDDLNIIFVYHDEDNGTGGRKIKTSGKMIDSHVVLEGLFTVVLYSFMEIEPKSKKITYGFITNNDGMVGAKSPVGMFPNLRMPNDMGAVVKTIHEYYEGE
jgi:hypothetical protein